jgi:DNA-binding GntR family transcriptional regulator
VTSAKPAKRRGGQNVADVHGRLRTAILYGDLAPAASVSQARLSADFGAGRTPLREALRLLQREGLVIAEPNRQIRIATLSADDFEELSIARLALEAVAIRITVPTLTTADIAELEGTIAQMDHYHKADDHAGVRGPHRAFHATLVAAAGPRVRSQIAELADHAERYRVRFDAFGSWDDRRAEHRAILDAAAAGEPDRAADRLAEHYARTAALVFDALDPDHDLRRLHTTIKTVAPHAQAALTKD